MSSEILVRLRSLAGTLDTEEARGLVSELDSHRWFLRRLPLEPTRMFAGDDGTDEGGDSA